MLKEEMGFPPKVYQFLVGTFAALGSLLYGYDLTIVAEGKPLNAPSHLFTSTENSGLLVKSGIQWLVPELLQSNHHRDRSGRFTAHSRRFCRRWISIPMLGLLWPPSDHLSWWVNFLPRW